MTTNETIGLGLLIVAIYVVAVAVYLRVERHFDEQDNVEL
jgi:hypothetical protein